jgi:putative NADH-flavin reductase
MGKGRFVLMNILILGAIGRVGSQIVKHALHDGHHVTALVRTPEKIQITNEKLTIIQGNVLNEDDIVRSIGGIDYFIRKYTTDHRSNEKGRHTTDYQYRNCWYFTKQKHSAINAL